MIIVRKKRRFLNIDTMCEIKSGKTSWGLRLHTLPVPLAEGGSGRWDRFAIYRERLDDYASNCDN